MASEDMRSIPGFPGYFVTCGGDVYSNRKAPRYKRRGGYQYKHESVYKLRPMLFQGNRRRVDVIGEDGRQVHRLVAVLVLTTFVGPRPDGHFACHGALGSMVDSVDNLYWGTPKQNTADRKRDGTYIWGQTNPNSQLNEMQVRVMRRTYGLWNMYGMTYGDVALVFGVNTTTAHRAITGRTWATLPGRIEN